jgi:hypothetical protein
MAVLPPGLAQALAPVLEQIAGMTVKVQQYDRTIKRLKEMECPDTQALPRVYGVGQLTGLIYLLRSHLDVGYAPGLLFALLPTKRRVFLWVA